jgi:hypothetical protein
VEVVREAVLNAPLRRGTFWSGIVVAYLPVHISSTLLMKYSLPSFLKCVGKGGQGLVSMHTCTREDILDGNNDFPLHNTYIKHDRP